MPAPRQAPMAPQPPRIAPHVAAPVSPIVVEADPDLGETGQVTVPVVRGDLPLPSVHEFGDTGEQTVPRQLAPKAPSQLAPSQLAPSQQASSQRPQQQYDLPPPAYRPPPPPGAVQMPNPIPQSAVATLPRGMNLVPAMQQSPVQTLPPGLAQMATPMPQPPASVPVPSVRPPSAPTKMRSPPVFVAVMVACTVLTITGLVLLGFLKLRHFW